MNLKSMFVEAHVVSIFRFRDEHPGARAWVYLTLLAVLAGCATPAERIDAEASELGFARRVVSGGAFRHVVYVNESRGEQAAGRSGTLHVYLEGDGSPWIRERWIASDPTPRNPVLLRLMSLDGARSVYLGRPCYLGLADDPACDPMYWTSARYSPAVLDSTEEALHRVMEQLDSHRLVLIGHSGGGALAMLLAGRFEETAAVVTLGGNLDTDAWTALHGYSPLDGSLNPAKQPPLDPAIRQIHLVGENDTVVPPEMVRGVSAGQSAAVFRVVPRSDHACCWGEIWPDVLRCVSSADAVSAGDPVERRGSSCPLSFR